MVGATAVGLALRQFLNVGNLALVFISAIAFVAARFGLAPSLFACVVGSLAFNFFFLPPLYRLMIADPENVVALAFFLAVAVFVSNLAARTRSEVFIARRRAKVTAELYSFSQKLAGIIDMDDLLWATAHQIASMLKVHVVILLPEEDRVVVRAGFPPEDELDASDLAAAKWSWEHDRPAGRGSDTLPGGKRLFVPLRTARGVVGVIGIDSELSGSLFTPEERRLLEALLDQAAVSIERIRLAEDVDKARLTAETERLRSSLLTSVSHDLRTPLASILGAASSLRTYGAEYSETTRNELATMIEEEAERLNRFVGNLLDTTRLESGSLDIKRELTDIEEIVGSALQRAGKVLVDHSISVDLAPDLPMLPLDGVLLEQALFNLLDNAAKYAPAGTRIEVRAELQDDTAVIQVIDEGPGIPPQDLDRLFDKFYRIPKGDQTEGRDRSRPGDLPRLHRGAGWSDRGRQSPRSAGRRLHHYLSHRRRCRKKRRAWP